MANIDEFGVPLMSEDEFERAIEGRRFSETNRKGARIVLCHGRPVAGVAAELEIERQQLHRACDAILSAHRAQERIPSDWVRTTVHGPKEDIRKFKESMEKKLRALHNKPTATKK